ncbi:Cytochrome b5 reductase 4 [Erysiphe necator]|nr:Cytochrome b5 reductase 4 [Erysiphe necator]
MLLFGLSVFIASIWLLCLRQFPRTFNFLVWPRSNNVVTNTPCQNKNETKVSQPEKFETLEHEENTKMERKSDDNQKEFFRESNLEKEISDNNVMPPPPLPSKKNTSFSNSYASIKDSDDILDPNLKPHKSKNDREHQNQPKNTTTLSLPKANLSPKTNSNFFTKSPSISSLSPLPNRVPNGLATTAVKSSVTSKSIKKVMLKPGHSPLDWARLSASSVNLSGLPSGTPYLKVPPSLLKQYTGRKGKDAWTVLGNKVYNITPYLPFHPGGEPELLRSAGRDGTKLFTEVHPWVNWEGMLNSCFVGIAIEESELHVENRLDEID